MDDKLPPQSSTESPPFCSLFIAATWTGGHRRKVSISFCPRARAWFLNFFFFFFPAVIFSPGAEKGFSFFFSRILWGGGLAIIHKRAWPNFGYGSERKVEKKIGFLLYFGYLSGLGTSEEYSGIFKNYFSFENESSKLNNYSTDMCRNCPLCITDFWRHAGTDFLNMVI